MGILIWPGIVYTFGIILLKFIDYREFKESPDKGNRYKALPLMYKLVCPLVIVPMSVGALFLPINTGNEAYGALFLLALILFAILEGQCVKWYRKNGLL